MKVNGHSIATKCSKAADTIGNNTKHSTCSNLISKRRDDTTSSQCLQGEVVVAGVGHSVAAVPHPTALVLEQPRGKRGVSTLTTTTHEVVVSYKSAEVYWVQMTLIWLLQIQRDSKQKQKDEGCYFTCSCKAPWGSWQCLQPLLLRWQPQVLLVLARGSSSPFRPKWGPGSCPCRGTATGRRSTCPFWRIEDLVEKNEMITTWVSKQNKCLFLTSHGGLHFLTP